MPTNFDTNFMDNNNDPILANHVAQYAQPINDLENDVDQLQTDVTGQATDITNLQTAVNGKQDSLPTGTDGQVLQADSGAAEGVSWTDPGGGQLSELSDVDDTLSPMDGEILQYVGGNSQFESRDLSTAGIASASDISGLQGQIDNKADDTHTHNISEVSGIVPLSQGGTGADLSATGGTGQVLRQDTTGGNVSVGSLSAADMPTGIDASNLGSGTVDNTEFGHLDGVTSPIQTQLDGHSSDISANTSALSGKQDVSQKGQAGGYAGLDATSAAVPLAQGGTGADLSATGGSGQVLKQDAAGGNVSVGPLSASDMPGGIDASKLGAGIVDNTEFGHLNGVTAPIQTQLDSQAADIANNTSELTNKQNTAEKNQPGGYAGLDGVSGAVPINKGGTSATDAAGARANLGAQAQDSVLDELSALNLSQGDILVYNGSGLAKLASGTDGDVLQSNSASSNGLGVEWTAPGGGGGDHAIWNMGGTRYLTSTGTISFFMGTKISGSSLSLPSNGQINILDDGQYVVSWHFVGETSYYSLQDFDIYVRKNGSELFALRHRYFSYYSNDKLQLSATAPTTLSAGDSLDIYCYKRSSNLQAQLRYGAFSVWRIA